MLHKVEHFPWSLRNPGIETSIRVCDSVLRLELRLELVVDQPKVILTVPQRKGLLTESTTDARDRRLLRSIPAVVPSHSELSWAASEYISRTAMGLAALLLASTNHERAFSDDKIGKYVLPELGGQF